MRIRKYHIVIEFQVSQPQFPCPLALRLVGSRTKRGLSLSKETHSHLVTQGNQQKATDHRPDTHAFFQDKDNETTRNHKDDCNYHTLHRAGILTNWK
jgi:hypothetical protein